jgi:CspA family cold shock protein
MANEESDREFGEVKVYYPLKGFGFIQRAHGKDVFFYRTDAASEAILIEGAVVSFTLKVEQKGPRAFAIVRAG